MSTYLDFRCEDCGVDGAANSDIRCGAMSVEYASAVLTARRAIETLAEAHAGFELRWSPSEVVDCDFFLRHRGHRVEVVNGYGQVWDAEVKQWRER